MSFEPMCVFGFYGGALAFSLMVGTITRRSRVAGLERLARKLEDGRAKVAEGWFAGTEGAQVTGRLSGIPVRLTFRTRGSGKRKQTYAVYRVEVSGGAGSVRVRPADVLTNIARWFGIAHTDRVTGDASLDRSVTVTGDRAAIRRAAERGQGRSIAVSLRALVEGHELDVDLRREEIVAEHFAPWDEDTSFHVLRGMVELARVWGRQAIEVKTRGVEVKVKHMAWTGGGASALCPFCRDALDVEQGALEACPRCDTLHHAECLTEAGGCTVFGCQGPRIRGQARA